MALVCQTIIIQNFKQSVGDRTCFPKANWLVPLTALFVPFSWQKYCPQQAPAEHPTGSGTAQPAVTIPMQNIVQRVDFTQICCTAEP